MVDEILVRLMVSRMVLVNTAKKTMIITMEQTPPVNDWYSGYYLYRNETGWENKSIDRTVSVIALRTI